MKNIIAVFAVSGMVILASCAGNRNQGTYSNAVLTTGNEVEVYVTELPTECADVPTQEKIMNAGELIVVKCSCIQEERLAEWYNTVNPQIGPADYCHAPYNGLVFRSNMAVAVRASASSALSTSAPPPAVTAKAPAPPPELPTTSDSLQVTDLKYSCSSNGVAERTYKTVDDRAGSRTTTSISQQCVGQGFTCLTDPSQQRDTSQPPCGCADGLRLTILSGQQRTWGCQSL